MFPKRVPLLSVVVSTCVAPLFSVAAESSEVAGPNRPPFSWDTVPRAISVHKPTPYTDDEFTRIASYDLLQTTYTAVSMAEQVKLFNPNNIIIGYKNLVVHYEGVGDPLFQNHPDWFLHTLGKPELHGAGAYKHPLYDLRRPEVRDYWIHEADRILRIPAFDGILIDGYAKVIDYGPVERSTGQNPPVDFVAGYRQLMEDHVRLSGGSGKIRIGNYLRAKYAGSAVQEVLDNLDGSYLEWFDHYAELPKHLHSYEEYLAAGIEAVQKVAREGKVIYLNLKPEPDRDTKLTNDAADPAAPGDVPGLYQNFEYKLAIFLIAAGPGSYLEYQADHKVTRDVRLWAPDFPEFHKPLGPPKGPAVREGFTYTREFEYAGVRLDLSKREGHITWRASYPEARELSPSNGGSGVAPGPLSARITFDRAVAKGSGLINLYLMRDRKLLASVPVESDAVSITDNTTLTATFPVSLAPGTQYSITVAKGAVKDSEGMRYQGMPVLGAWKFVTD